MIPVLHRLADLPRTGQPLCLAAGFFDGVHRGHQRVIAAAVRRAARWGGACWVLSFDVHPRKVVRPGEAPVLLTDSAGKARLFEAAGAAGCLLLPFTPELAAQSPRRFLDQLHRAAPDWRHIAVGADWRFGRGGRGDVALLTAYGRAHGIAVEAVRPVVRAGMPVSSTRVREAIRRGAVGEARALLGRPFSLQGRVVRGGRWGRRLGWPTANLEARHEIRPADGVYACRVQLPDGSCWPGVVNIGRRPTLQPVSGPAPILEVHLIGFRGNLYGREIVLFFQSRLRGERPFDSPAALAAQIRRDVQMAAARLRAEMRKKGREECFTPAGQSGIVTPRKHQEETRSRKTARGRFVHG